MATSPSTPVEKSLPKKPTLRVFPLQPLSANSDGNTPSCSTPKSSVSWNDCPISTLQAGSTASCSTPKSNVSWNDSCISSLEANTALQVEPEDDDDFNYDYILPSPCIFKLLQLIITIVCMGLYMAGLNRIVHSITSQLFPYIICAVYLTITPVILFSYALKQRMPELLIRIFNMLAGILFFVSGVVVLQSWALYIRSYEVELDNTETEQERMVLTRQGVFLLASGILSFINSALYFADVIWSIRATLATL